MYDLLGVTSAIIIVRLFVRHFRFFFLLGLALTLFYPRGNEAERTAAQIALSKCAKQHHLAIDLDNPRLKKACGAYYKKAGV